MMTFRSHQGFPLYLDEILSPACDKHFVQYVLILDSSLIECKSAFVRLLSPVPDCLCAKYEHVHTFRMWNILSYCVHGRLPLLILHVFCSEPLSVWILLFVFNSVAYKHFKLLHRWVIPSYVQFSLIALCAVFLASVWPQWLYRLPAGVFLFELISNILYMNGLYCQMCIFMWMNLIHSFCMWNVKSWNQNVQLDSFGEQNCSVISFLHCYNWKMLNVTLSWNYFKFRHLRTSLCNCLLLIFFK